MRKICWRRSRVDNFDYPAILIADRPRVDSTQTILVPNLIAELGEAMERIFKFDDFSLLEYETLRQEIATAKKNMFQLMVGGSAAIPAVQSLANTYNIGIVTLALPLILSVYILMFISENHAMMRAGQYILEKIEPIVQKGGGWETWLNTSSGITKTRSVDRIMIFSFSLLASFYFLVSVVLAWKYTSTQFGSQGKYVIAIGYFAVGLSLAFVLYSQARTDTEIEIKPTAE